MKIIGFIDYYISEWHANNYPAWIKEANAETGLDFELKYAWAEQFVSPVDGVNTDEWCEKYGVTRCSTIAELCEKCDAVIILAPSNPEKHLEYARQVLPFGKPTYIDKPFAESGKVAEEIFALSEKYGTPFFSSSALRYATELNEVENCVAITTQGGGGLFEEYIIHQAEMVVKKLGAGASSVKATVIGNTQHIIRVDYANERKAAMHFILGGAPFQVCMTDQKGENHFKAIGGGFFQNLIKDILRFFETKEASFDTAETLAVARLVECAIMAKNSPETEIKI